MTGKAFWGFADFSVSTLHQSETTQIGPSINSLIFFSVDQNDPVLHRIGESLCIYKGSQPVQLQKRKHLQLLVVHFSRIQGFMELPRTGVVNEKLSVAFSG